MPGMTLCSIRSWPFALLTVGAIALLLAVSSRRSSSTLPTRTIAIQQNWQLQPGATVAGHTVQGGVGVEVNGTTVFPPYSSQLICALPLACA